MSHFQDSLNRALQHHQTGRLHEAIYLYHELLQKQSTNAQVLYLLGTANLQIGQQKLSVEQLQRSLALNPNNSFAHNNLGSALMGLKRINEALESYDKALAIKPDAGAYSNRGNALKDLKRLDEALESYDEALALRPDSADVYYNRGIVLQDLKRLDEALESYDKALALKPDNADAYINRGVVLYDLKRLVEALKSYDNALVLRIDDFEAIYNRGNTLRELKRLDEALASYDKALVLNLDYEFLKGLRLILKMQLCHWQSFADETKELVKGLLETKPVTHPFVLLGLVDSPELHLKASQIYADKKFRAKNVLGPIAKRASNGKIRIGYYSADFHNHATAYLMAELFEEHDASRFELFGFSFGPHTDDDMRQRLTAGFDRFIDVRGMSDRDVAKLSRELGIDIAVDLKGYTQDSRTGIFAERVAPIQVNYLGYPGTMGVDYIDYIIADKTIIPLEQQANYSEKVVYLPYSYQVNDSKRKISDKQFTKQALGLPEEGFVFCCFNNNYKILPATFDGWMRMLQSVEGSVLWLLEDNPTAAANLRKEAEHRGIDGNRLIFAKRVPLDEHLARHRYANLFIDSLPCNAHTTTSDALWAGLPVLTCMGQSFASRVAASLLNAIDLPELITTTQEKYEAMAIDLARHPDKLREIKEKLDRNRLTAPLFDTKLFTKHIEAAYKEMYDRYQVGLHPDRIEITRS